MGFLEGKRVLVAGARNKWSIGWHCALSMRREGADLAFSVYSDREKEDIHKLLEGTDAPDSPIFVCNATKMEEVEDLFERVGEAFDGKLDGLLHSIAYAPREALAGLYVDTAQADFALAMDSSVYTLLALTRGARPLMQAAGGGGVVTMTYLSQRVVPRYNVMGVCKAALEASVRYLAHDLGTENIRINAVSAGPIKTLAAQGIQGFSNMLNRFAAHNPLQRNIDADEVGDAVAFLLSPLARGITGETLFVDAGFNVMGM